LSLFYFYFILILFLLFFFFLKKKKKKKKGSLPKGLDGSTYEFIVKNRPSGTFVFLDVAKNVDCLKTGNVDALKINFEEAYGLCPKE